MKEKYLIRSPVERTKKLNAFKSLSFHCFDLISILSRKSTYQFKLELLKYKINIANRVVIYVIRFFFINFDFVGKKKLNYFPIVLILITNKNPRFFRVINCSKLLLRRVISRSLSSVFLCLSFSFSPFFVFFMFLIHSGTSLILIVCADQVWTEPYKGTIREMQKNISTYVQCSA